MGSKEGKVFGLVSKRSNEWSAKSILRKLEVKKLKNVLRRTIYRSKRGQGNV